MSTRITKPFFAYRSFNKELDTVRRFYEAGIRQFCVFPSNTTNSLGQNYSEYPFNWYFFNEYEFEHVDKQIQDVIDVAPDAEILFMIDLNTPYWLVRQLQGTLCDSMLGLTDALTTPAWQNAVTKYMHDLLTHVEATFPGRVAAYILACGQTDEWMDYSKGRELECKLKAFQEWSKAHGHGVPECIPPIAQCFRSEAPLGLRNDEQDAESLRFWRFISDTVADSIAFFAREARKLIPDTTKLGCFFGYILELCGGRLVECGHLAYEKVFSLPELDFFISPGDYEDRDMGGAAGPMSPNGTIHLKGKNFFHEIDHRTSTGSMVMNKHVTLPWMKRWANEKENIAGLRREYCLSLFHGASLWWFDMWGKFYESQTLVDEIASFKRINDRLGDITRQPEAEVAVFVDPDSTYYVDDSYSNPDTNLPMNLYRILLNNLNRLGAPYRVYSFNDLPAIDDLNRIRLAILPGFFKITSEKENILKQYLFNHGRTIIWTYAAALSDGIKSTPAHMEELIGVPYGTAEARTVQQDGWTSVFTPSTAAIPPNVLRNMAKASGVHLFTDEAEPVWYANGLLMVHTVKSGKRCIHLKRPAVPHVLLGRSIAGQLTDCLEYDFDAPETILIELEEA